MNAGKQGSKSDLELLLQEKQERRKRQRIGLLLAAIIGLPLGFYAVVHFREELARDEVFRARDRPDSESSFLGSGDMTGRPGGERAGLNVPPPPPPRPSQSRPGFAVHTPPQGGASPGGMGASSSAGGTGGGAVDSGGSHQATAQPTPSSAESNQPNRFQTGAGGERAVESGSDWNANDVAAPSIAEPVTSGPLMVGNVHLGRSLMGEQRIKAEILNQGDRTVNRVVLAFHFHNRDGAVTATKRINPLVVASSVFGAETEPLAPNRSRRFALSRRDAPPGWSGRLTLEIESYQLESGPEPAPSPVQTQRPGFQAPALTPSPPASSPGTGLVPETSGQPSNEASGAAGLRPNGAFLTGVPITHTRQSGSRAAAQRLGPFQDRSQDDDVRSVTTSPGSADRRDQAAPQPEFLLDQGASTGAQRPGNAVAPGLLFEVNPGQDSPEPSSQRNAVRSDNALSALDAFALGLYR